MVLEYQNQIRQVLMSHFSASKQKPKPPINGVFPLDHFASCKEHMESYKKCLKKNKTMHHKCQDVSKVYLQCRQENALMAETPLEELGYGHKVENVGVKTDRKEDRGFTAGAHIKERKNKGWFW
ncbi:hypothetical protein TrRE_jg260 [Triparma retinervis]|uniref:Cytochrome c oxidase assembly protein COX19 n=1 Tax=Triparma retinervis TaxID=2557542 RepID=A0A9W6ZXR7_9STRA|nr:hypothetical protein TrRE_jg260 [Triparma retinervis]